jgi:hypothetical protein
VIQGTTVIYKFIIASATPSAKILRLDRMSHMSHDYRDFGALLPVDVLNKLQKEKAASIGTVLV